MNNKKQNISTDLLKPYIENQNQPNVLITNEIYKEIGHYGICNKNSTTEPLSDSDFISRDSMAETNQKIDECNEEPHQNFVVNTPGTIDSQNFGTFKIGKNSANIINTRTNSKNTKQNSTKMETYEGKMMKVVFDYTSSDLASFDFYKIKKKRDEKIPLGNILDILVPLQKKKNKKQIELSPRQKKDWMLETRIYSSTQFICSNCQ